MITAEYGKMDNARHHPPPQAIGLHDKQRVGGRVHAVVRFQRPFLPHRE
jgi:hypothetical protein